MIYEAEKNDHQGRFKTGHTQETETEGLWVYPYPLCYPQIEDVQFLLLDMEGMGGILVGQDREKGKEILIDCLHYQCFCLVFSQFTQTLESTNQL